MRGAEPVPGGGRAERGLDGEGDDVSVTILNGDARDVLLTLPAESVQCCVTSPPYFGLRDYGVGGQIGLEASPDDYVAELVAVFRAVRRVLRDDGVLFLNLGDSYSGSANSGGDSIPRQRLSSGGGMTSGDAVHVSGMASKPGKPKDLLMIPARVALALQADGWWLRSDIIWAKPNPMPESVTDRPTSAHEHVFLLAKSARYYWDADAIAEEQTGHPTGLNGDLTSKPAKKVFRDRNDGGGTVGSGTDGTRNIRNVWTIATQPYSEAHFATFPPKLAERCIKAGSKQGDTILDPFAGAFTAPMVADRLQRNAIGIELNADYCDMAQRRLVDDGGMFMELACAAAAIEELGEMGVGLADMVKPS